MKKINFGAISVIISVLVICFTVSSYIFAWTEPTLPPPQGNVAAPINVSATSQSKLGNFGIGGQTGQAIYWFYNDFGTLKFNSTNPTGTRMVIGQDGNVGIGTTGPNQKLQVVGGQFGVFNGTADRGLTINPGLTAGIVDIYSDYLGGSEAKLHLSSYSDRAGAGGVTIQSGGNVGIGTTSPGYKLDVNGALRLQPGSAPTSANGVIYYDSGTNKFRCYQNGAWTDCIGAGGGGGGVTGSGTASYIPKWTTGTTLGNSLIYDNGTKVGIGTTSPGARLVVKQSANSYGWGFRMENYNNTNFWEMLLDVNSKLLLGYNGTNTYMVLDPVNGNVGIGTTTPQRRLDVGNTGQITFGDDVIADSQKGIYWHSGSLYGIFRNPGSWAAPNYQQLQMTFATGIIIDGGSLYGRSGTVLQPNGGNVGIGVTGTSYRLDVLGNVQFQGPTNPGLDIRSNSAGTGTPFIDFSNDPSTDYDVRLRLTGDDVLTVEGGSLKIPDGTQGNGKVLTSDANGLASWQTKLTCTKATMTNPPNTTGTNSVATCPSGYIVTGGGGDCNAEATTYSGQDGNGWRYGCMNHLAIQIFAICCR